MYMCTYTVHFTLLWSGQKTQNKLKICAWHDINLSNKLSKCTVYIQYTFMHVTL